MPSPEDAETLTALTQGVDHIAREAEAHWGVGRLPLLVSDDLRAKFARQGLRWRTAMEDAWSSKMLTRDQLEAAQASSGAMQRAWLALDAQAKANGAAPLSPDVWEVALSDGSLCAITRTGTEASAVIREGRLLNVWTLEEVARAIEAFPDIVRASKEVFPGAKVVGFSERRSGKFEPDSEVPF